MNLSKCEQKVRYKWHMGQNGIAVLSSVVPVVDSPSVPGTISLLSQK